MCIVGRRLGFSGHGDFGQLERGVPIMADNNGRDRLGVRRDGQKVLLAVKNMGGETEVAWRHVRDLLARGLKVPDLTSHGLQFRGARLFTIDRGLMVAEGTQPAALLVYGLPNGKPLALCITPFTSKADEYPVSGRSGDINLLSWFQSGMELALPARHQLNLYQRSTVKDSHSTE